MIAASPSLIGRIRHRLAAAVWLFALAVLGQGAFSVLCVADGLEPANSANVSVADAQSSVASERDASHETPCWHGGGAGCHCACAHASGLPVATSAWPLERDPAAKTRVASFARYSAPSSDNFRPPIA